jgi:hypothetical protein
MRDVNPSVVRWICLFGGIALAGQTIWTTRQGWVYRSSAAFVRKADDPARYRMWVGFQWLMVASLLALSIWLSLESGR